MYNYAITLIKNSNPVWISDYENFIKLVLKKDPNALVQIYYEDQRQGSPKLHCHGIISNARKIKFANYTKLTGVRCNFSMNPDQGWIKYCQKNIHLETSLCNAQHEIEHQYNELYAKSECVEAAAYM